MTSPGPSGLSPLKRPAPAASRDLSPNKKIRGDSHKRETYNSSGIKANFHGDLYQVKLLMLYLLRALKKKYDFKLATEMDAAEKFDDIVFIYLDENKNKKYRFLQAKHKQDESGAEITLKELLSTDDRKMFSLRKYFSSYYKILSKPDFKDGEIEDFTIATNIEVATDVKNMLEEVNLQDNMFKHDLNKNTKTFKFKAVFKERDSIVSHIKSASELQRLADELAEFTKNSKRIDLTNALFKTYREILVTEVIDAQGEIFKKPFLKGDVATATGRFYHKFAKTFQSKGGQINSLDSLKLKISKSYGNVTPNISPTFPNDVTDNEISGFFEMLVFAVKLPNEEELSEILEKDLREEFEFDDVKLNDVGLVASNIFEFVINWVKEKQGYLLTQDHIEEKIRIIKQKLAILLTIGPTSRHKEKLANLQASFIDNDTTSLKLNEFLTKSNMLILHLKAANTTLGALRVFNVLQSVNTYANDDTHIFTTLKKIVQAKTLLAALSNTNILLVIDCNDDIELLSVLFSKINKIVKEKNTKIILLTNHQECLSESWQIYQTIVFEDNSCFDNLTPSSQDMLLRERQVKFLGHEISFDQVIDRELRQERNVGFKNELLISLLDRKNIVIGEVLPRLDEVQDFYIGRTFQRQLIVDRGILKSPTSPNIFALSNISVSKITKMNNRQEVQVLFDILRHNVTSRFLAINDDFQEFEKVCEICSEFGSSIHWLNWVEAEECFVWRQSLGTLTILRQFIDSCPDKILPYNPQHITDIEDRFVLIAAEPGMGKTTVLTHLATQSSLSSPSHWIIRINLLEYCKELREAILEEHNMETAYKLLQTISKIKTPLSVYLFESKCRSGQNVSILFDGFDEISPDHKEKVLSLVKMLKFSKIARIWLTTRSHLKHELEDKLSVFAYGLKPFTWSDQEQFLKMFWKKQIQKNAKKLSKERLDHCLRIFSKRLLELTYRCIPDKDRELTGIPLQTKMLAEAFLSSFEQFSYSDLMEPTLPNTLDILDLYESFVWNKYIVYSLTKVKLPRDTPTACEYSNNYYSTAFIPQHNLLALAAIFTAEERKEFLSKKLIAKLSTLIDTVQIGKEKSGIIIQNFDGKLLFVHRTFAEYFCAKYFTSNDKFQEHKVNKFLKKYLFLEGSGVIRNFFDRMLAKSDTNDCPRDTVQERDSKYDLHQAALNNNIHEASDLLKRYPNYINLPDEGERSALHLSATCGHVDLTKILLDSANITIDKKDEVFSWSPTTYAAKSGHWKIVDMLLGKGASSQDIKDVEAKYEGNRTLLHIASENGYLSLASELVSKLNAKWDVMDENRMIPLHVAALHNRLEIVQVLKEKGGTDRREESDRTPLEVAINGGSIDVVKYLGAKLDNLDALLLHTAVNKGDLDLVKMYLKDECVNYIHKTFTPLHQAAFLANYPIVEYLVEKGADVNLSETMVSACGKDNLEVVKLLIKLGANIHTSNDDNFTPIHAACRNGALNVVEYLLTNKQLGIDVNVRDDKNTTPLQTAAYHHRFEVVQYLIDPDRGNADINLYDWFGATPIFSAVLRDDLEIIKLLFRNGAQIEQKQGVLGALGLTELHVAAVYDSVEIVQLLVEEGNANVNAGEVIQPLHLAAMFNSTQVIEYLVSKNADVDVRIDFFKAKNILNNIDTSLVHSMDRLIPWTQNFVSRACILLGFCEVLFKFTPNNISKLFNFNNEILNTNSTSTVSLIHVLPSAWCQHFQGHLNKLRLILEHHKGNQKLPRNVIGDLAMQFGYSKSYNIPP